VAYPDKILATDEEVVLHLHPHWRRLVRPVLVFLLAAGAGGYGVASAEDPRVQVVLLVLLLAAVCVLTVWPVLRWASDHVILTTHRILVRTGVLSRSGRDVPLGRVDEISFRHTLLERILRSGTLTVESAGDRGELVLRDVPRVELVQAALYELVDDDSMRRARAVAAD
jgi:membrane protein YdbS with pleckstrin-like domain